MVILTRRFAMELGPHGTQMLTVDGGRMDYIGQRLESSPEQVAIERRARAAWLIIG